ncbi:MAG TPA: ABC transporter permease subunit, partial [Desulfuromonadales bacterium]|nr:ABC transporter permease subunit [Desulfuromonadales bacterium]
MLDWGIIVHYFPFLVQGALLTLKISVIALLFGFIFGLLAALLKLSPNVVLRWIGGFYVWIIRSTPLLVQLFLIYFGLPQVGIDLGPFMSGVLALAINT